MIYLMNELSETYESAMRIPVSRRHRIVQDRIKFRKKLAGQ